MATKPNIILVYSDQHRGDTMGCAGNPVVKTPNLDSLAAEGVVFSRCSTNAPLCMPARASLITGKYVNQHGIWNNGVEADPHSPSHVRNIRDAGYHTALIGKTHLWMYRRGDGHTRDHAYKLKDWGYDYTHELRDIINYSNAECYYSDYLNEKNLLPVFQEYLRTYVRGIRRGLLKPWELPPSLLPTEVTLDMYTAKKASDWLESYNSAQPFYLQLCFPGPHDPFDSPAEFRAMYRPEDMPLAIMDKPAPPIPASHEVIYRISQLETMTPMQNRVMRVYYYAKVSLIDHALGTVLSTLRKRGLMDNTWIVYTSDHGEMLGDHLMSHKAVFYEAALNVPFIIRPPGGTKGWVCTGLTDHFDLVDSLLEVTGARQLEDKHGVSLATKIDGGMKAPDAQKGRDVIFSEVGMNSMVRTERYKMVVHSLSRKPLELYDTVNDPRELHNLFEDPSKAGVRKELGEQLVTRLLNFEDKEKTKIYRDTVAGNPYAGTHFA
jgi:choline-sulfatase